MANVFTDYEDLKQAEPETYELIVKLTNQIGYKLTNDVWDFGPGGWNVANNPSMVTDQQWRVLALRTLSYETLKETPISKVIESFGYELRAIKVEDVIHYVPSGNIMGWMQGIYVCINVEGQINS